MMFSKLFPGVNQILPYNKKHISGDLSAGLIIAVMLIPQGMAYAMLAGLDPVIGLYAVTIPLLIYALFASSKQLAVGPVAIVALLVFTGVSSLAEPGTADYVTYVILLTLMIGLIQFFLGLMKAGFFVNFLSHAVISGFTSAAAIVIGLSQIGHLFGIDFDRHAYTHLLMIDMIQRITDIHLITLLIGMGSIVTLILSKKIFPLIPAPIVVVIISIILVYTFGLAGAGVNIVGQVPQGLPGISIPLIGWESIQLLVPIALTISFVGFMESIAIAKAIAAKEKDKLDPNEELRGLGLSNIAASFFSAMPVAGSFSRSAVNYQAGAKTVLSSIVSAVLIMFTLLFLTGLFYYLPNAVLAAIIIVAVYGLIDLKEVKHLFQVKAIDGYTLLITFFSTLFIGIEQGIIIGVIFSLLVFIWRSAYPHIAIMGYLESEGVFRNVKRYPQVKTYEHTLIIRVDSSIYFANMGFLEDQLHQYSKENTTTKWIIMDMAGVNDMDAVAIDHWEDLIHDYKEQHIQFLFANMKGPVRDLLHKANWKEKYGETFEYMSIKHALTSIGKYS